MENPAGESLDLMQFLKDWQGVIQWLVSSGTSTVADALRLHEDLWRLKTTLPRAAMTADEAEWWRFAHPGVGELLARLKDAVYDAEDVLDEFSYQEAHQRAEGLFGQASQLLSSSPDFFKSWALGPRSKVRDVHGRLEHAAAELKEAMDHLRSRPVASQIWRRPPTSSFPAHKSELVGRDDELKMLIELFATSKNQGGGDRIPESSGAAVSVPKRRRTEEVKPNVVAIVGMGGMGKTALAQYVFNHQTVREHFMDQCFWVSVSDDGFDVLRITKEILYSVFPQRQFETTNLNYLQAILLDEMKTKRFLLVLDDVWNEDLAEWHRFYSPFADLVGAMILVTTRSKSAAEMMSRVDLLLYLNGLPADTYKEFFKTCAFGYHGEGESSICSSNLQWICCRIADKLGGSPLAAKTVGALLSSNISEEHWRTVMDSELWELNQNNNGILTALQISFQYLPAHLKRCFSFCSIFPRNYTLQKEELIDLWIALDFVAPEGRMRAEDIAAKYLDELTSRFFFDMIGDGQCYRMHDLMREVVRSASFSECLLLPSGRHLNKIPSTVRHVFVHAEGINMQIELDECKKLRSLVTDGRWNLDINFATKQITSIRCLKLDAVSIKGLPEHVGNLRHLRYLDISKADIATLPSSFYCLYNLQVLYLGHRSRCSSGYFQKNFSKLTKLRKCLPATILSKVCSIGKLTSLQTFHSFDVRREDGYRIGELKNMTQLQGSLQIKNLENVSCQEEAKEADLDNKIYLTGLVLHWSKGNTSASQAANDDHSDVLEGLQPNSSIKLLEIKSCRGTRLPTWLNEQDLPCLDRFVLYDCINFKNMPSLPSSITKLHLVRVGLERFPEIWLPHDGSHGNHQRTRICLTELLIENCFNLTSLSELLDTPCSSLKTLCVKNCAELNLLPENFTNLPLKELKLINLPKISCQEGFQLPYTLTDFEQDFCQMLETWFPESLVKLSSLSTLKLRHSPDVKYLPSQVTCRLTSLKNLILESCKNLTDLEGLKALTALENLHIVNCPSIRQSVEPLLTEIEGVGMSKLIYLTIDDTQLLKMQFFKNGFHSLQRLKVCSSKESHMFDDEAMQEVMKSLRSLKGLCLQSCTALQSIHTVLHLLPCLETLSISDCPFLHSLPSLLPPSIRQLQVAHCDEKLMTQLDKYKEMLRPFDTSFTDF
ncbi:disease resistance protein RGA2-like [Panicum virgatum]|uniref:Uncharacterized protein n=1 Tax=Panicum virgatum TaxID=38727 RepID=A0A8T0SKG6_PANVG|nr:disease resistance protein RGA2-like [Panicum virgatum]KAG2597463.1 hypothetical protein PVAP13_5KG230000 [Panicum virgatum]